MAVWTVPAPSADAIDKLSAFCRRRAPTAFALEDLINIGACLLYTGCDAEDIPIGAQLCPHDVELEPFQWFCFALAKIVLYLP